MDEVEKLAKELYEKSVPHPNWAGEQEHTRAAYRARVRQSLETTATFTGQEVVGVAPFGSVINDDKPSITWSDATTEDRFPPTELPVEESKSGLPKAMREELDGLHEVAKRSRGRKRKEQTK